MTPNRATPRQGLIRMAVFYVFLAFALTAAGIHLLLRAKLAAVLLDIPGTRSNHAKPTPRIGGLAICAALAVGWAAAAWMGRPSGLVAAHEAWVAVGALVLALLSLADDIRALPAVARLAVQAAMVGAATLALPPGMLLLDGAAPLWLDRLVIVVAWVGFLNATNFMDGIDGITGLVTLLLAAALLVLLPAADDLVPALPAILIGAAAGFLWFNWHPARTFLGDAGSVVLGFALGGLLLSLALRGELAAAAILPAYYLVDTGCTLLERGRRGEKIWRAHSDHAYQRAVRRGVPHDWVASAVGLVTLALAVLAFGSRAYPLISLVAAYGLALALYLALRRGTLDRLSGAASVSRQS
jgi:UDP-N-acetylmuramyl pentapeptide phosphotransferase/UDP-N-acetylglucosamine-1-phosphate transferase